MIKVGYREVGENGDETQESGDVVSLHFLIGVIR